MRLVGRDKLFELKEANEEEAATWLKAWASEVVEAQWAVPKDLLEQYPNAQNLGEGRFRFPVGSADLAIDVMFSFAHRVACILQLTKK